MNKNNRVMRPIIRPPAGLDKPIEDFEYLLHHIEVDRDGKETTHHCLVYDHIGNMFLQGHLIVKDGHIHIDGKEIKNGSFHIIVGLEPTQEVTWSDEEARRAGIDQKPMHDGLTRRQKSAVW